MPTAPIDPTRESTRMQVFADGAVLWAYGDAQIPTPRPAVSKSTDGGATWTPQDTAHASDAYNPSATNYGLGGIHARQSGRKIWFLYFHFQAPLGTSYAEFQTFNLDTGVYSVPFGSRANTAGLSWSQAGGYSRILETFEVCPDGKVVCFFQDPTASGIAVDADRQLYAAVYDPGADSWSSPVLISDNAPAGTPFVNTVSANALGTTSQASTVYLFYDVYQYQAPSQAIYYRTITTAGALTAVQTIEADTTTPTLILDRSATRTDGGDDLDPSPGYLHKTWCGFQNVYIRGSSILAAVNHANAPALLTGTGLTTPTWTYSAPAAGAAPSFPVEAYAIQAGADDYMLYTAGADTTAGIIMQTRRTAGTWSTPAAVYTNPDSLELPAATQGNPAAGFALYDPLRTLYVSPDTVHFLEGANQYVDFVY
jgi:hypothetical protein